MADLIDRQALIKRLKVWDTPDVMDKILYNFALNRVLEMPTIEAEPVKHGRWIDGKCSRCGHHAPFWAMASTYYRSRYCPNCGARMDGGENDRSDRR